MIKKILILINISITLSLFSSITIPDSKPDLPFDSDNKSSQNKEEKITSPLFSFKIGNIPGSLVILGSWNIKLGFGAGFVLYPELMFLANVPDMKEGIVFEQERLFALDWTTENGIDLHLFFNDDLEQSELTFKYQVGKIFNSIYITNKFSSLKINPYRTLKGGKVSDINIGFDWGHKIYAGRFDLQFDSAKKVNDSFKGNNRYIENKIYSSSYLRGVYYYLPDKNITGEIIVYLSDDNGEKIDNLPEDFKDARKYKKIEEGKEFKIDAEEGAIVFNESIHGKTLLINYKTKINNNIYEVGDINCGIKGVYGTTDFSESANKDYFVRIGEKRFLILSFLNKYSYFEEKNSYKIAGKGISVKNLNIDVFDDNNIKSSRFNYFYDDYTGCVRIVKNSEKKTLYNIYPFFDSVIDKNFYLNNVSPKEREAKNSIRYEGIVGGNSLTLSQKPVNGSISVFVNSTEIESKYYSYDYIDQSVNLSFEVNENDTIDIYYIADENDAYNLTASLKNDFKLGDYIMLSDSFWYKMPIKLWENSFYNKLHCAEFIYDITLNGNFRRFLADNKNGKLNF
ncbi:MAG TPA: hypothetical protein PLO89_06535, partial [Spirochaetota bacterium]|nr:hypothetical protein [Spirochaetota bacterium]